jgi:hypothetical protein
MQPIPMSIVEGAPFYGPWGITATLAQGSTAPFEGVWVPVTAVKFASVEVQGTFGGLSIQLIGSNATSDPPNVYTLTVGGTITANDPITLTFTNPNLQGESTEVVSYTVQASDGTSSIAAALAAAIRLDAQLQKLGITAAAVGAVVTVTYPSTPPNWSNDGSSQTNQPPQNLTIITPAVGGSATETVAVANASVGGTLGSAITATGLTTPSQLTRFIKAQVNTLSGGSAANPVTANYHGAV